MKALSIKNPMGILIALGIKPIENRTRRTHFRGKIYIHVSAKYMDSDFLEEYINDERFLDMSKKIKSLGVLEKNERIAEFLKKQPVSAIIGEVEIVDCVINHESIWADYTSGFEENGEFFPNQKPIYNWILSNPVLYEKPILNVKGKLSFWEPDIDIQQCTGCEGKFDYEFMEEDDGGNHFCTECWEVLSPIMAQEAKENAEQEENE